MCDRTGAAALLVTQPVIFRMSTPDAAGINGHRAVEEHRNVWHSSSSLQLMEVEHQDLGAADRECRDNDSAAAADGWGYDFGECILRIAGAMPAVAIGRFDQQIVRMLDRLRVHHHPIIISAEVARNDDASSPPA